MILEAEDDVPAVWESLFHQAVEVDPASRKDFLDRHCGPDTKLRQYLQELLNADESLNHTWERLSNVAAEPSLPEIPDFESFEYLGQGGMGTVYRAYRKDRLFESKAFAVKVLHAHRSDPRTMARFESEKRLLASLDHPAIAGSYEGGTLPDGRPFLVMDYIDGHPLDVYCREERSTVEERLTIFVELCGALQHAHQNLVVHRDLKPSNILIDSNGNPHLLDFGIAKHLQAQRPEVTTTHHRPMTPAYASPEQVVGGSMTTASDLYSLGVVLFELLTDTLPPAPTLSGESPTLPALSSRINLETATLRRTHPRRLTQRLKGDLQSIVRKAMQSDPQQRFGSAQELADDIGRHLTGRPVLAHRGNWRYIFLSFLRRHRTQLLSLGISVFLLGGLGIWHTKRMTDIRNVVLALTGPSDEMFMTADIRENWVDLISQMRLPTKEQATLIDQIRRLYVADDQVFKQVTDILSEDAFSFQGSRKADVALLFGDLLIKRSRFKDAESIIRLGIAKLSAEGVGEPPTAGYLLHAEALAELGRYQEARSQIQYVLQRTSGLEKAEALQELAAVFYLEGAFAESEDACRQGLGLLDRLNLSAPIYRSHFLKSLAVALSEQDPEDPNREAQTAAEEALNIDLEAFGRNHFATIQARNNLMMVLGRKGRFDEATQLGLESLGIAEEVFGRQDPKLAYLLTALARAHQLHGDSNLCVETARRAVDLREFYLPRGSVLTAISKTRLADCLAEVGESEEAITLLMSSLPVFERSGRKETKRLESVRIQLAELLQRSCKPPRPTSR